MIISGVYKIVNTETNQIYIGSSINLNKRKNDHFYLLKKNKHTNKHLQNSFNKYGEKNFEFIVLKECEKNECIKIEQIYINEFKPFYNINPNAGNSLGIKHSKETIEKIKNTKKGHFVSEETKEKMSKTMKNKIKNGDFNNNKWKNISKEEYDKNIKILIDKSVKNKKNKIVCQYTLDNILIKEWISINDIERTLKHYASHISKCCNNKKKTAYGHIWKFKQQ